MKDKYTKNDKMFELLNGNERLLQVISRFAIPLGVGEKTIEQICKENQIDVATFLAIVNFTAQAGAKTHYDVGLDLKTLCKYLQNTHKYMLNFYLPHIRRHLIDALGYSSNNDITFLIIKFFDEYCDELKKHMDIEDKEVFPYIDALLAGKKIKKMSVEMTTMHRSPIELKLSELKNIIIKYYSSDSGVDMTYNILQHLFMCEYDLFFHDQIETYLLIPEIKRLEELNSGKKDADVSVQREEDNTDLTDREKDIIIGVVKGLTNKEIADKLFISINTVTTHRRNIARKLNIHSPSGLTIYAIVNNLVDIKDIQL